MGTLWEREPWGGGPGDVDSGPRVHVEKVMTRLGVCALCAGLNAGQVGPESEVQPSIKQGKLKYHGG